ncbi:ABC transporter ATP-binding protein [Allocoprobacillus halotolerans]|uniref:ABC transporter ATP-binding protein n=1 Tax=Allocoprobacillus halotolerans TaxID=2944914 RepID=A0ABY5I653_9FIRM|nr:ABC transporter ATP-binding protein [Allocoprobacillus halotolerans]UTY40823.1 ABC transporter ATP-binding protein [Allocoprobacillus halotolerans]
MDTVLTFEKVSYHYQDGSKIVNILKDANFIFEKGKTYAIVGASGSGKTTALSLASGLDKPKEGRVLYNGQDIVKRGLTNYRRHDIAIVFQAYNLIMYMNAIQNVVCAMDIAHMKMKNKQKYALSILKELGLSEEECQRDIRKLSGGQQQRVAIARAIAKDVDFILCDEPTGNLDEKTTRGIIQIFVDLAHQQNKCVIVVTHSKELAACMDVQLKIDNQQLKIIE